ANSIQYDEAISHLLSYSNLTEGMNFSNFKIAIHYCIEFGCFNGFVVRKKELKRIVIAVLD
ncbi:784_t:CDS:1, partial [Funneliformis caledonium]